jgi:hypothetical protein
MTCALSLERTAMRSAQGDIIVVGSDSLRISPAAAFAARGIFMIGYIHAMRRSHRWSDPT